MSVVCLKLLTVLSVCCTALSGSERNGATWKKTGESITIQCRPTSPGQDFMCLKKGLSGFQVFFKDRRSGKESVVKSFRDRIQTHGDFPNVDILIKNLTSDDTDPYWCEYEKLNPKPSESPKTKGEGSVLLVVTSELVAQKCEEPNKNLILVSVVICAVLLLSVLMAVFVWIIKTKTLRATVKPQRVSNNDVYEDMRGTIRR